MANVFKEAKKIHRQHPRLDWQECIQRASKKRKRKRVGATRTKKYRQTGKSNRKADTQRHAKAPGKRKASGSKSVYYERRKNRSDVPGHLTGISVSKMKRELVNRFKTTIDNNVVKRYHAKTKTARKKITKTISEAKKQMLRYM